MDGDGEVQPRQPPGGKGGGGCCGCSAGRLPAGAGQRGERNRALVGAGGGSPCGCDTVIASTVLDRLLHHSTCSAQHRRTATITIPSDGAADRGLYGVAPSAVMPWLIVSDVARGQYLKTRRTPVSMELLKMSDNRYVTDFYGTFEPEVQAMAQPVSPGQFSLFGLGPLILESPVDPPRADGSLFPRSRNRRSSPWRTTPGVRASLSGRRRYRLGQLVGFNPKGLIGAVASVRGLGRRCRRSLAAGIAGGRRRIPHGPGG